MNKHKLFQQLTSISIQTENTLTHNTSVTDVADDSSPELEQFGGDPAITKRQLK